MQRGGVRENQVIYPFVAFGVALAVGAIIFGSVLPFMKSRRYTYAIRTVSQAESVEEVKALFGEALTFYSPIGDSEVTRFSGDWIFSIISEGRQSEAVDRALVEFIEPKIDKGDVQHLILFGYTSFEMWGKHHNPADLKKAEMYFLRAREIGPKLPTPLYGLLDVYRSGNDMPRANATAKRILELWPKEKRIQIRR